MASNPSLLKWTHLLSRAIRERRVVELVYDDAGLREVEPYVLYLDRHGWTLLSAYQRAGYSGSRKSTGWKTFEVDRVRGVRLMQTNFAPRADYVPGSVGANSRVVVQV